MRNYKMLAVLLLSVAMLAFPALTSSVTADEAKERTVQGEVLDLACYASHGAHGEKHAACAARCVKGGQPMGLLAEDGTVYLLMANHKNPEPFEAAKEFAGKNVKVSGPTFEKSGMKVIEVRKVEAAG